MAEGTDGLEGIQEKIKELESAKTDLIEKIKHLNRRIRYKKFEQKALEPYLEQPSPTTCLVLCASKTDTRKKPYPSLKKNSVGGEFSRLYED